MISFSPSMTWSRTSSGTRLRHPPMRSAESVRIWLIFTHDLFGRPRGFHGLSAGFFSTIERLRYYSALVLFAPPSTLVESDKTKHYQRVLDRCSASIQTQLGFSGLVDHSPIVPALYGRGIHVLFFKRMINRKCSSGCGQAYRTTKPVGA